MFATEPIAKSARITRLVEHLYAKMPEVEAARAQLITESYRQTEGEPMIMRRAKAFAHVLAHIPIIIRPEELIVGSATIAPRGCQTFPEFSWRWLQDEFDQLETRSADPFYISQATKEALAAVHPYWEGRTTSDLATSYMAEETKTAMEHNFFTPGNYFYNGIGHVTVDYGAVLNDGLEAIIDRAERAKAALDFGDGDWATRSRFLDAVILANRAAIDYAARYAALAAEQAQTEADRSRRSELEAIAEACRRVPGKGARNFAEACQSFWFIHLLIQIESSGHSISPGRFDQYMYPFYAADSISREQAQELIDCVWVKINDLNKVRDGVSAEGFAGYSLFQNLIVGGQNAEGMDVTNDLSFMCIEASDHVHLPQPSLSVRVWNGTPHELLIKAAELTRTGIGLPAYYNDEVIIPSLISRGLSLADAREYGIIGCVEPQRAGKTDGWHDAAFFNMLRPLEMVFSRGQDDGVQVGPRTADLASLDSFDAFLAAYKAQMSSVIGLLVNADNAIDQAHAERCPLPFLSGMIEDCIGRGKSVQEGGAIYNFTGPQGFGVANVADSAFAVKTLVYEQNAFTLTELSQAMAANFGEPLPAADVRRLVEGAVSELVGRGIVPDRAQIERIARSAVYGGASEQERARYREIRRQIEALPKYGNDCAEVDALAREMAYFYTRPLERYSNPRGGSFQAGLYPVSANVPLGAQTGATPDGRLSRTPVADGVSPTAGKDTHGPTAAANSVAKLDHFIASNGTLFNMKFHPTALSGRQGLESFVSLVRGYFDQKGSHMQFNVVSRETLLDAQAHPEAYKGLVVRVAGYSALFTSLSRTLQDDIINRTEQAGF